MTEYYPSTMNARFDLEDIVIFCRYDWNPNTSIRLINKEVDPLSYEGALYGFKVKKLNNCFNTVNTSRGVIRP